MQKKKRRRGEGRVGRGKGAGGRKKEKEEGSYGSQPAFVHRPSARLKKECPSKKDKMTDVFLSRETHSDSEIRV